MKKVLLTITLSTLLWSCGGSGGDIPSPPPLNKAPSTPTLVYPTNNLVCINNVLDFNWTTATDPEGDGIRYQVQVATDGQFTQLIHNVVESTTLKTLSLEKGIAYYWRVKAVDSKNASSNYSNSNSFYTEGEGIINYLPFTPVLVAPVLNSLVIGAPTTTNLQWTASDVDTTDTLTYDVYFDTSNPPTAIESSNLSTTTLNVNLSITTTYYWKVVVKDGKGGQTIGQVWSFQTD